MLARLLHSHDIPCIIFESEASIDYRAQGGTLDLRTKTGLAAVKEAGLWEEFLKYARFDGESLLITDKKLIAWLRRNPGKPNQKGKVQEAPEIDRADLRQLLAESIPKDCIRWGRKLAKVQETDAGLQLHFTSGEIESGFDLIVGCDGAFSKTRNFLSSEKPSYTGLSGWTMQVPNVETTAPDLYKFVNRGSVFAYSDGKSLSVQQLSSGNLWVSIYAYHPDQYGNSSNIKSRDLETVKKSLSEQFDDWAPELRRVFDKIQGEPIWRRLYMLPVGFKWPHKKGITLLGDAAHLMSPFSGIGVNTALYDALLLSRQVIAFNESKQTDSFGFDDFIVKYEDEMLENAHKAQAHSEGSMRDMMFTPGAPRTTIESYLLRHVNAELPAWSHPLTKAVVHPVYWVYKCFV